MSSLTTVYVTVGSTKFDALIQQFASDEILSILKAKGCQRLVLQVGKGSQLDAQAISKRYNIEIEQYDFKIEAERTDILNADLVIGHAGAGTCLDILVARKPGILVINDQLMNNHQQELAMHIKKEGYLACCTVEDLKVTLENLNLDKHNIYEVGRFMHKFVDFMDDFMAN